MKQRPLAVLIVCLLLLAGAWFAYRNHQADRASTEVAAGSAEDNAAGSASASAPPGNHFGASPAPKAPLTPPPAGSSNTIGVSQVAPIRVVPSSQQPQNSQYPTYAPPPSPGGQSAHADQDLEKINRMLRDFRTLMGENPVGTNAEIMKAIMGNNGRKAQLLQDGVTMNGNGEIVDPWGNPYFFHQLSGTLMEVRSAGPDGVMWTGDDIIRK